MANETQRRDRPALAFDLPKAIAEARAEFPEETRDFTFIDLSAPDARQKLTEWMNEADPEFREKRLERTSMDKWLDAGLSVGGFATRDNGGRTLLGVRSAAIDWGSVRLSDPGRTLAYIFAHEFGHALVEGGLPPDMLKMFLDPKEVFNDFATVNRAESAADSFAALYGFRKGWLDGDDVKRIANQVAAAAGLQLEFMHFTTFALEPLVLNAKGLDFLSLTPQEIRAIAARHAGEFALDADEISRSFTKVVKAMQPLVREAQQQPVDGGGEFGEQEEAPLKEKSPEDRMRGQLSELAKDYAAGPPGPAGKAFLYFLAQRVIDETFRTGRLPGTLWPVDLSAPEWDAVRQAMPKGAEQGNVGIELAENKADILPRATSRKIGVTFASQLRT